VGYNLGSLTGLGNSDVESSAVYGACTYSYSGYNGVGGDFGSEWIRITCTTDRLLTMKVRRLLPASCCLMSSVCCLLLSALSAVCCLLSAVYCRLSSAVCYLLSAVCWLLSAVCCLLSAVCGLRVSPYRVHHQPHAHHHTMQVAAYQAGTATVSYTYWNV
jgi:hypothetical protein